MQVNEVKNEGLVREFTVKVPATDIAEKVEEQLAEVAKTVKIAGFRPGHVPLKIVKQHYAKGVTGEVVEKLVHESSHKVLDERNLKASQHPKIEITAFEENSDLEYSMKVELLPEIPAFDFASLELDKMVAEVEEKAITEALENLAKNRKSYKAVERKAENNDKVIIDYIGKIDGVAFEGGTANSAELVLGSNSYIPGFEEQLVGSKAGDEVVVKLSFPTTYHAKDLAGKEAEFDTKVVEVQAPEIAEINDELAAQFGFEDLNALKEAIQKQIAGNYEQSSRIKVKKQLFDTLDEKITFDVPPSMFAYEFTSIWKNVEEAKTQGDEALKDKSDEELKEEYSKIATRRVKLGLLLSDIASKNSLKITREELSQAISEQAKQFPGNEGIIYNFYQKNPERLQELHGPIMEEKAVNFIIAKAKITEIKVSAETLLNDEEDEEAAESKKAPKTKAKKAANA